MKKFKVGNRVKCMAYGVGTVVANDLTDTSHHNDCVLVKFDDCCFQNDKYNLYRSCGSSFGCSTNDHIVHINDKGCINNKVISLLEKVLCELKNK